MILIKSFKWKQYTGTLNIERFSIGRYFFQLEMFDNEGLIATFNKYLNPLERFQIAIDINNCGEEIISILQNEGIIGGDKINEINLQYTTYPVYELTDKVKELVKEI